MRMCDHCVGVHQSGRTMSASASARKFPCTLRNSFETVSNARDVHELLTAQATKTAREEATSCHRWWCQAPLPSNCWHRYSWGHSPQASSCDRPSVTTSCALTKGHLNRKHRGCVSPSPSVVTVSHWCGARNPDRSRRNHLHVVCLRRSAFARHTAHSVSKHEIPGMTLKHFVRDTRSLRPSTPTPNIVVLRNSS